MHCGCLLIPLLFALKEGKKVETMSSSPTKIRCRFQCIQQGEGKKDFKINSY